MSIIANPEILEEDYIPLHIPCREIQKKELAFCISQLERGRRPLDCLCHGNPGTGKTVLVRYLLNQLRENTNAHAFYVNCWENRSLNQVLDKILRQTGLPIVNKSQFAKISGLKRRIRGRACIIALDEVDRLRKKDLNDILYLLKGMGKVGVICISNTREYVLDLDPRINSRLSLNSIKFPPYSDEELMIILKQRIVDCRALYPRSYSKEVLEEIIALADGDARIAIQTLKNAAYLAEKRNGRKISLEDVRSARGEMEEIKRKYVLEKLGKHYKLIYDIIKQNQGITSSRLVSKYRDECIRLGLEPRSSRTLSNYLERLIALKYIKFERASVRGNVREFYHLSRV